MLPICLPVLLLVGVVLESKDVDWGHGLSDVSDLRREVVRWISRCHPSHSFSTHTQLQILQSVFQIWNLEDFSLSDKTEYLIKILNWVVRVHLDSVCIGAVTAKKNIDVPGNAEKKTTVEYRIDRAVESVLILPDLCLFLSTSKTSETSSFLLNCLAESLKNGSRVSNLESLLNSLLKVAKNYQALCNGQVESPLSSYSTFFPSIFQNLFLFVIDNQFDILQKRILDTKRYEHISDIKLWDEQMELLIFEPKLWTSVVSWGLEDVYRASRESTHHFSALSKHITKVSRHLASIASSFLAGHMTVEQMRRVCSVSLTMRPAWEALRLPLCDPSFMSLIDAEINDFYSIFVLLQNLLMSLMPLSDELKVTQDVLSKWGTMLVNVIRKMIDAPMPERFDEEPTIALRLCFGDNYLEKCMSKYPPLAYNLLSAADWLNYAISHGKLFEIYWEDCCKDLENFKDPSCIPIVAKAWADSFDSFLSGTLSLNWLEKYGQQLISSKVELSTFVKTASGIQTDLSGCLKYSLSGDSEIEAVLQQKLCRWNHVSRLHYERELLDSVITASAPFFSLNGKKELSEIKDVLVLLNKSIDSQGYSWDSQKLLVLEDLYWPLAEQIDPLFLNCNSGLLLLLQANMQFVRWLRIQSDDGSFSSSIEMAMGATEMDTPVELWDSMTGRVNEKLFSMLRNVRSYLHSYLYFSKEEYFETISLFVNVFGCLNASVDPGIISQNIVSCKNVYTAFSQVIDGNNGGVAHARLGQLYNPRYSFYIIYL